MGCGASAQAHHDTNGIKEIQCGAPQPVVTTWATRRRGSGLDITVRRKTPSSTPSVPGVGSKGAWGIEHGHNSLTMTDADDESEIEIIYEGKAAMTPRKIMAANCANAQEAPEIADLLDASEVKASEPVLSKRQQAEAAKLAEQRRRFDNQRYQRELTPANSPHSQGPAQGTFMKAEYDPPGHELIMGLNLTEAPNCQDLTNDCLPGGIAGDSPRVQTPKQRNVRNKHDVFDDDDEVLMKEILDSWDD